MRWTVKYGKEICGQCHDRLEKEMPYDKWHRMNITQIRQYCKEKERIAAQKECSFCGRAFDKSDIYKTVLKDNSLICYKCTESMRLAKPVLLTSAYHSISGQFEDTFSDPIKELTIDDVPWAQKDAAEERERRIAKYGDHKGVFIVDDVTKYIK